MTMFKNALTSGANGTLQASSSSTLNLAFPASVPLSPAKSLSSSSSTSSPNLRPTSIMPCHADPPVVIHVQGNLWPRFLLNEKPVPIKALCSRRRAKKATGKKTNETALLLQMPKMEQAPATTTTRASPLLRWIKSEGSLPIHGNRGNGNCTNDSVPYDLISSKSTTTVAPTTTQPVRCHRPVLIAGSKRGFSSTPLLKNGYKLHKSERLRAWQKVA